MRGGVSSPDRSAGDADNLEELCPRVAGEDHSLAESQLLVAKETTRFRLIDDRHGTGLVVVTVFELSARRQRNAHRAEVPRADDDGLDVHFETGRAGLGTAFNGQPGTLVSDGLAEWRCVNDGCALDARDRPRSRDQVAIERVDSRLCVLTAIPGRIAWRPGARC